MWKAEPSIEVFFFFFPSVWALHVISFRAFFCSTEHITSSLAWPTRCQPQSFPLDSDNQECTQTSPILQWEPLVYQKAKRACGSLPLVVKKKRTWKHLESFNKELIFLTELGFKENTCAESHDKAKMPNITLCFYEYELCGIPNCWEWNKIQKQVGTKQM